MDHLKHLLKRAKRHVLNDEKEAAIVVLDQVEEIIKNLNRMEPLVARPCDDLKTN